MAEGERLSTREWLDPSGPLRPYRRLVGGLVVLSVLATVAFGIVWADATTSFLAGMLAIGVLGVSYLLLWAVDLVAIYTDPDGSPWQ